MAKKFENALENALEKLKQFKETKQLKQQKKQEKIIEQKMIHRTRKNKTQKKKDTFFESLLYHNGLVTMAADDCGILKQNHYYWMKSDEIYREKVESIKENVLDKAKSCIIRSVEQGNSNDAKWYIQYLGKTGNFDYNKNELQDNKIEIIIKRNNNNEQ